MGRRLRPDWRDAEAATNCGARSPARCSPWPAGRRPGASGAEAEALCLGRPVIRRTQARGPQLNGATKLLCVPLTRLPQLDPDHIAHAATAPAIIRDDQT